jgi:hypothetical protein
MRAQLCRRTDRATSESNLKKGRETAKQRPRRALPDYGALRHAVEPLETRRLFAAITVTTTADTIALDTFATLREAVTSINNQADVNNDVTVNRVGLYASQPGGTPDVINFNIAGGGVHTINVTGSPEPTIIKPLTIDGYSQSGASVNTLANSDNAVILIELNGTSAGAGANGLTLGSGSAGSTIRGLAVNRFSGNGIVIQSNGNSILGNFVGTNAAGTARSPNGTFPNSGDGIRIENASNNQIGSTNLADRNIASGNSIDGIHILGTLVLPATGNILQGNFVGVAADGVSSVGNRTDIAPAPGTAEGNNLFGIEISGGNLNTVGGSVANARNVVGFNADGIELDNGGQQNIIEGNFVGVGADGVTPAGNILHGIVIRSSNGFGPPLGPAQAGEPGTSFNRIGGTAAGAGNLVEFNAAAGVAVFGNPVSASGQPNVGNAIEGNSIYQNGRGSLTLSSAPTPLLGIDLSNQFAFPRDDGFTANNSQGHGAANDPNNFQNFPILTAVTPGASTTDISGNLSASPNTTYRVELFANNSDPLGLPAEGQQFVGFVNVTTDGAGQVSFTTTVNTVVLPGQVVTATATDPVGNTSEFSPTHIDVTVTGTGDTVAVDGLVTLREAIISSNAGAPVNADVLATQNFGDINHINFNISGGGVQTISPTTALPTITRPVVIDGYTQPGSSVNTLANGDDAVLNIVLDGSNAGTAANGLKISAGNSTVEGLVIHGFVNDTTQADQLSAGGNGIVLFSGGGNVISGNILGSNNGVGSPASGSGVLIGTSIGNVIGGTTPAARNILSGNGVAGVYVKDTLSLANVIQGNFIGTDVSGTAALGNQGSGIYLNDGNQTVIGGSTAAARNVISGNGFDGVSIGGSGTRVEGNFIGTDVTGTAALGNGRDGVSIFNQSNNIVGGPLSGEGNVIAFNQQNGVNVITNVILNAIRGNSIFSNVGLGIDLNGDGVTPNDPNDADGVNPFPLPNHLQNFPVLGTAVSSNGSITITGIINTNANVPIMIDFYASPAADPSGFGEGKTYLGALPVALDASSNNASFTAILPYILPAGQVITATATDVSNAPYGDTSEFSQAIGVTVPPSPPVLPPTIKINDVSLTEGNSGTKDFNFTVTLSHSSSSTVTVHYNTQNGTASSASDYQFKSGTLTFSPGQTSKTVTIKVNGDTTIEANETFFVKLSSPTNATISDSSGTGTIVNDDPTKPKLSVSGSSNTEGNSGLKAFTFKVTMDKAWSQTVSVHYATSNGTAIAGSDYNSASGTVTFAAGETVKTVTVFVKGDLAHEADETFFVKLSSAVNATIAVGTGKGTIRNDD